MWKSRGAALLSLSALAVAALIVTGATAAIANVKPKGALVSKLILDKDGNVVSGERAYDFVYHENEFVGPAPAVGNNTRPFSRFCSGSLAGPAHGFDRYIYLTNEEEGTPANTHDRKGGLAVAIWENKLYTLPKLGRFAWENTLVQPTRGKHTVVMGMEDGPAALAEDVENSQVYLYVGKRSARRAPASCTTTGSTTASSSRSSRTRSRA